MADENKPATPPATNPQGGSWSKDASSIQESFNTAVSSSSQSGKFTAQILGGSMIATSILLVVLIALFSAMRNRRLAGVDNGHQLFRTIIFSIVALVLLMTFVGLVSRSPS
ncbi:MAG: hypothetical protein ACFN9G_00935 [Cardiobacterium sp.]|jgi:hypothetical protein